MTGEHDSLARDCMAAIDRDRTLLAAEAEYTAAFTTMDAVTSEFENKKTMGEREGVAAGSDGQDGGHSSGLKNQLLIGWRPPRHETTT